jgi:hypothetical protein
MRTVWSVPTDREGKKEVPLTEKGDCVEAEIYQEWLELFERQTKGNEGAEEKEGRGHEHEHGGHSHCSQDHDHSHDHSSSHNEKKVGFHHDLTHSLSYDNKEAQKEGEPEGKKKRNNHPIELILSSDSQSDSSFANPKDRHREELLRSFDELEENNNDSSSQDKNQNNTSGNTPNNNAMSQFSMINNFNRSLSDSHDHNKEKKDHDHHRDEDEDHSRGEQSSHSHSHSHSHSEDHDHSHSHSHAYQEQAEIEKRALQQPSHSLSLSQSHSVSHSVSQSHSEDHDHSHSHSRAYQDRAEIERRAHQQPAHSVSHSHSEDHDHSHSHSHSHQDRGEVERRAHQLEGESDTPGKVVSVSLLKLLTAKGVTSTGELMKVVQSLENRGRELKGAELVARAWKDPIFREKLLRNGKKRQYREILFFSWCWKEGNSTVLLVLLCYLTVSSLSLSFSSADSTASEVDIVTSNPNTPTILRVVANDEKTHHLIVCTLCSCYPAALLGLSPSWYKSRNYRARVVREPREVLREFGLVLPESVKIVVHDSTADCRYLVLPCPPKSLSEKEIQRMTVEELKALVTRDSMVGVAVL